MTDTTRRPRSRNRIAAALMALVMAAVTPAAIAAGQASVAVAANFIDAAEAIGDGFNRATGHTAVYSFGATGQLYAQIAQGAPFEVLLAADRVRPEKAVAAGLAVAGSRFTYATGRLVLYSADPALVTGAATLREKRFSRIAVANPATAPYGAAALAAMKALGVHDRLADRLVRGNNIAQTYQFVETGNAELGFVALSQVSGHDRGSRWVVPASLHAPIAQDAVLLERGRDNPAARAFIDFLKTRKAGAIMARFGYGG